MDKGVWYAMTHCVTLIFIPRWDFKIFSILFPFSLQFGLILGYRVAGVKGECEEMGKLMESRYMKWKLYSINKKKLENKLAKYCHYS